jgi:hypothetical protein
MHVLFVHKNFPAQFGHIARYLIDRRRFRCTFVSEKPPANLNGLERIPYRFTSGATDDTHLLSRTFVNQVGHSHGLFEALEARPDIQPDLIVAHSGFVSPLYLRELYTCPIEAGAIQGVFHRANHPGRRGIPGTIGRHEKTDFRTVHIDAHLIAHVVPHSGQVAPAIERHIREVDSLTT